MNKQSILTLVAFFAFSTSVAMAAPVDNGPPAQQQKNSMPDSTSHGDYIQTQPDENGATTGGDSTQTPDKKSKKHQKKSPKPSNMEKGKSHTESPDNGGVDVK